MRLETPVPFQVRVDRHGDHLLLGLFGELTISAQDDFTGIFAELRNGSVAQVVVDLSGLQFLDSTGLFLLLEIWNRCGTAGIIVHFEGGTEQVQRILQATGMGHKLGVAQAPRAAVAPSSSGGPFGSRWAASAHEHRPQVPPLEPGLAEPLPLRRKRP